MLSNGYLDPVTASRPRSVRCASRTWLAVGSLGFRYRSTRGASSLKPRYLHPVRCPLLLALSLGIASVAVADRLITIPLGRKIPFDDFKFDTFIDLSNGQTWDRFVGFGLTPDF